MHLIFKGRNSDRDVWVKSITFRFPDGRYAIMERTITNYTVNDEALVMIWRGCYIHRDDKRGNDFNLKASDFKGAEIVDISLNPEAPDGYEMIVSEWRACDG